MTSTLHARWDFAKEIRSSALRFVAFAILIANLLLGGSEGTRDTHYVVVIAYFIISIVSVATALFLPGRFWLKTLFVVLDGLLVAAILYAYILAPASEDHNLTTTSLVVGFVLLIHAGLQLDRRLVLTFSAIVLVSWVVMLAISAVRHGARDVMALLSSFFSQRTSG